MHVQSPDKFTPDPTFRHFGLVCALMLTLDPSSIKQSTELCTRLLKTRVASEKMSELLYDCREVIAGKGKILLSIVRSIASE
jgi:hypothetical protein